MPSGSTVLQTQTIADTKTDWTQPVSFAQFDPSLGTLVDVRIGIVGDVAGTASIENLGAAASVGVSVPVSFEVFSPDDTEQGGVSADPTASVNLGAFDGTADYAGSSGTVISGIAASANTVVVDSGDLTAFIGTNSVNVTAATLGNAIETGNGNLLTTLQTEAGAVVSVQYDYTTMGTTAGSSGSSGSSDSTSVIAPIGNSEITGSTTTVAQSFTVASSAAGWSGTLDVAKFNPALGTLEAVDVVVNGNIVASAAAENTGDSAILFATTQQALVTLGLEGTLSAQVAPITTDSMTLGSYDGTLDFAGTSGHTDTGLTDAFYPGGTITYADSETDRSLLAAFTGTDDALLPISSTGISLAQGGANLVSDLTLDAGANVRISYVYTPATVACFAAGTRIATPRGAIAVECLREGDHMLTVSGREQPIAWIGRRTLDCRRHPAPERVMPVRISAHAFGENRPARPLLLSPDHSVFIEDVLIPVKFLLNGSTISQIDVERVTYYHIELPRHDVVLAEGLPAETYLETGGRRAFENGGGAMALHPDFAPDEARVGMVWQSCSYAPLIGCDGQLDRVRARLACQALMLGHRGSVLGFALGYGGVR